MKNLNEIIGENLTFLRKKAGFTQLELGEKFNYSDKTVSKWEQGSVLPSVDVLKEIADFYGVSVDYILSEHNSEKDFKSIVKQTPNFRQKAVLIALLIAFIFAIGFVVWGAQFWTKTYKVPIWLLAIQCALWCLPPSALVLFFTSRRMFRKSIWPMIFASLFVWSTLAAAYATWYSGNYWFLFFIGVPLQIAIILIYNLRK